MAGRDEGSAGRGAALYPLLALAAVAVLVRLPLFGVPLDPDEGGYAFVAHRWAQGGRLYVDPWVDRPQGLILVFRSVTDVSYSVTAIRVAAVLAGVLLTVATACAAWAVGGRRAAVLAGLIAAVVGAGSFVEGYELNGELIGSAVGTGGVALALWWSNRRLGRLGLFAAGVLCGLAPLMKQSMLDAAVALVCIVLATRRFRELLPAVSGLLVAPVLALVDAARTGWSAWWYAVVRFQLSRSAQGSERAHLQQVVHTLRLVSVDLAGLALAAGIGLMAIVFSRRFPTRWPLLAWLLAATLLASEGSFQNPHYWVQVVAPLAVIAGSVSATVTGRRRRLALEAAVLVFALALPLARLAELSLASPTERAQRVVPRANPQRLAQADVAGWIDAHTTPSDPVYAFVAGADLYLRSRRGTTFPYLWYAPVQDVPGAREGLRAWLAGPDAPRWVVEYQTPQGVDPSGALGRILAARYQQVATVHGYPILRRRG